MPDENLTEDRRRWGSLAPEKILAVLISGAALAYTIFSAGLGAYGQLQSDTTRVNERVIVLDANITSLGQGYIDRAEYLTRLERELGTMREQTAVLSERLARIESREGLK